MNRTQAFLTAGVLTGVVIIALFWGGIGNSKAAVTAAPGNIVTPDETITEVATQPPASDMQSLLEQNRQLREAVTTLLNREEEYRRQIEAANQQLLAGQNSSVSAGQGIDRLFEEDEEYTDNEYEDDEHEDDEHKHDKHEDKKHEYDKLEYDKHEHDEDD